MSLSSQPLSQKLIKDTAALQQKKHRDAEGLLLVEGRHPIEEAHKAGLTLRHWFILADAPAESLPKESLPKPPFEVNAQQMGKLATTASVPPCLAVYEAPPENKASLVLGDFVVVLDGVQDPGNVGTLIRSALAFGADALILTHDSADPYNPKVIRASAGLVFALPLVALSPNALLSQLQQQGHVIWATTGHGGALPYRQADFRGRCALVLGNEGRGVSDAFLNHPQAHRLIIPMQAAVESLNVGISGSIVLAEAAAQRGS
ncbi:TrmH family RNA methyltransferase [Vampirovibrio chlorellavorus]|uniref:TrmH family RNA methyltransferase n=1 Tax=Vampirovibrio chlorellavorus TaxID=758823 RepID=UPI0026EF0392|nr:RNA methyltransferase [Vampirovibrio chlorellavorus]